jgi:hypothetical protein
LPGEHGSRPGREFQASVPWPRGEKMGKFGPPTRLLRMIWFGESDWPSQTKLAFEGLNAVLCSIVRFGIV